MLLTYDLKRNEVTGGISGTTQTVLLDLIKRGYIVHISNDEEFLPRKSTAKSHGFDCRINLKAKIKEDSKTIEIPDKEFYYTKDKYYRFDLNLKLITPDGLEPYIRPRSSLAYKKGLLFATSGIIDNDYFHPLMVGLYAIRNGKLNHGERAVQLLYNGNFYNYVNEKGLIFQIVNNNLYNNLEGIMIDYLGFLERFGGYGSTGLD